MKSCIHYLRVVALPNTVGVPSGKILFGFNSEGSTKTCIHQQGLIWRTPSSTSSTDDCSYDWAKARKSKVLERCRRGDLDRSHLRGDCTSRIGQIKGLNAKLSISRIQFSEYLTTNIAWYFLSIFWLDKIKPESQTLFFSITSSPWQVSLLGINLADHNVAATLFSESALACDEPCKSKHVSTLVICEIVGLYCFFVSQHRRQPPWSDKPIL